MLVRTKAFLVAATLAGVAAASVGGASASRSATADTVGTTFPAGFPVIVDASLGVPVIGFGAAGPVVRTPVIFLHGNNDTPYSTTCNGAFGKIQAFAQYFLDHGYVAGELWGLGYQGEQCDLATNPPNRSGPAHSTVANIPDLRNFVQAVLAYTGQVKVDIVGHSLGGTLARTWILQDVAQARVRRVVAVDSPNHGIINCSPNPLNFWQAPALGAFTPDSAICQEYGSDHTPLMHFLNDGDETPGPTTYLTIRNADTSFVYFPEQDGSIPPVPAEDREGNPHDFSGSARLVGAENLDLVGQGSYDGALLTTHLGIVNSPQTWEAARQFLLRGAPTAVRVHSFGAAHRRGTRGVTLRWRTGSDSNVAGFHVFRGRGTALVRRTRTLIPAKTKPSGSAYVFEDTVPEAARGVRYRLQAVGLDGGAAFVGAAEPIRR